MSHLLLHTFFPHTCPTVPTPHCSTSSSHDGDGGQLSNSSAKRRRRRRRSHHGPHRCRCHLGVPRGGLGRSGGGSVARHCVESSIEGFALLGLGQTWTQLVLWLRLPRCLAVPGCLVWCICFHYGLSSRHNQLLASFMPHCLTHTHTQAWRERERRRDIAEN